jgi:hypothetical protein
MVVKTAVRAESPPVYRCLTDRQMQMLGNLTNPPEPFGDVIRTHFRLKAQSITSQLDRWLQEDDGRQTSGDGGCVVSKQNVGSSTSGFLKDVSHMKKCLEKLWEGEWPTSEGM